SRIMHNIGFRYTNYLNRRLRRKGHIFQGRYKALLVDADSYLLEQYRYIHCNPVRARLVQSPEHYPWSSHRTYLGQDDVPWLATDLILSQFAGQQRRARSCYADFIAQGIDEKHRVDFHQGSYQGRILGDDSFSEKTLAKAAEPLQRPVRLEQIVTAICDSYGINADFLREPGKRQPGATARAVAAFLVQNADNLTLSELAHYVQRDLACLSRAAGRLPGRLPKDTALARKLATIQQHLEQMSKCQA
nr:transposase [Deltaproteobacteria bacterium]